MLTILGVLSIFLSIGLVYLGIKARTTGVPIFSSFYIINDKFFGEPTDLRFYITPNEYAIQEEAKKLKTDSDLATVSKTYNFLSEKYNYVQDDLILLNSGQIIAKGGIDSWNLPILTLAEKHQYGEFWVDCEDGTFLLVSLLRANGLTAWANIGTVTINSSIYGHAWATVFLDGKEYLLETTLGEPLAELKPVPSFYKVDVKFNEKDILAITGADINKKVYPPLPPAKVQDLKDLLGKT